MLQYRSFADLDQCIARNLWRIPSDVDLIAGIPRSGLMAATMLALHLNLPLTSLDQLVEGRVLSAGQRLRLGTDVIQCARKIVVIDDSISTGSELRRVRNQIESVGLRSRIIYIAVYATEESADKVDIHFEICPQSRVFAWNLMHRQELAEACVDIDGVLCVDPTEEQNDDGPVYERFLEGARPLLRPTCEIGAIVTSRLERYRPQTESWLLRHGIKYRELVMWDLPSKAARAGQQWARRIQSFGISNTRLGQLVYREFCGPG